MLTGKTSVYIDTTKTDDDTTLAFDDVLSESVQSVSGHGEYTDEEADEQTGSQEAKKKKPLDRSKFGRFIRHYEHGKSFGEIALLSEDSVRNATVIADEDTDLLVIYRDLFNRSMKAKQEEEYEERKEFIAKCPLFSNWSIKFKRLLEMSIRKEEYPFGATIVRQGEPVSGLIFIVKGQATVIMEPAQHYQQYPKLMRPDNTSRILRGMARDTQPVKKKKTKLSVTQDHIRIRRKEGYAAAERRLMGKSMDLCSVEDNEIIGDVEMIMGFDTNSSTVTCTANTVVFIADTKTYERLILKKNQHTVDHLRGDVLKKLTGRISTPKGSQVPLLKNCLLRLQGQTAGKAEQARKSADAKQKENVFLQLIDLFLKDKAPLIPPFVPDSLYYRQRSDERAKLIESQLQKEANMEGVIQYKSLRKAPRSMRQLRGMNTENQLLTEDTAPIPGYDTPEEKGFPAKDVSSSAWLQRGTGHRPSTALGIARSTAVRDDPYQSVRRPGTAGPGGNSGRIFHLTECDVNYEDRYYQNKDEPPAVDNFGRIFEQIDNIQKEKYETRSKLVCSVAAKEELKAAMSSWEDPNDIDNIGGEEYFDWETSDTNLRNLEDRLRNFYQTIGSDSQKAPPYMAELRRYDIEHCPNVPLPGGTVFVRKRRCRYPRGDPIGPETHQHVRRFIVSREEVTNSAARSRPLSEYSGRTQGAPKTSLRPQSSTDMRRNNLL